MSIGDKIKKYRVLQKMTQKELAKKANISRSYLADVENGRYNPSIEVLTAIANALNIPVDELFKNSNENNKDGKIIQKINPKFKPIIDSLDRAGDLQDEDIDEIVKQLEFLINYRKSQKGKNS
ncbi:MAG: helix-turn-helix domain-containing protein [Thermoanaerobacter sp.]|uniref:helix-turn-helix domain-containing protein n=1 Tax=Thermoanaerobacter sp. TaxID=1755 RepID=UPI003463FE67